MVNDRYGMKKELQSLGIRAERYALGYKGAATSDMIPYRLARSSSYFFFQSSSGALNSPMTALVGFWASTANMHTHRQPHST